MWNAPSQSLYVKKGTKWTRENQDKQKEKSEESQTNDRSVVEILWGTNKEKERGDTIMREKQKFPSNLWSFAGLWRVARSALIIKRGEVTELQLTGSTGKFKGKKGGKSGDSIRGMKIKGGLMGFRMLFKVWRKAENGVLTSSIKTGEPEEPRDFAPGKKRK